MAEVGSKTTRAAIHEAALVLFVERGFGATTMSDIAEAAGISRRSLYRYFEDKEAVFFDYLERETAYLDELLTRPELPVTEALRSFATVLTEDPEELDRRAQVLAATPHLVSRALLRRADWEVRIARALAQRGGLESPTLEMKLRACVALGALYLAVRDAVYGDGDILGTVDRAFAYVRPVLGDD
jgi:AcrR family transcriptional regulator